MNVIVESFPSLISIKIKQVYRFIINKLSTISSHYATAIDHIWHNHLNSTIECWNLMSETSGNSPCFVINIDSVENAGNNESIFVYRIWK